MGINITNYVNNQFEPKKIESGLFVITTNQTSDIASDGTLKFITSVSNMTYSDVNHQVTLKAGKKYKLLASCKFAGSASSAYGHISFYDITNSAYVGTKGYGRMIGDTSNTNLQPTVMYEVTTTVDTVIECRIEFANNLTNATGGSCFWTVQEIQSEERPDTYPFLVNAKQYELVVTDSNWTTLSAVGVPYKTIDGSWKLWFSITGTYSSGVTEGNLTIAGVTFKDLGAVFGHCVTTSNGGTDSGRAYGDADGNGIVHFRSVPSAQTSFAFEGTVPLNAKPSFL